MRELASWRIAVACVLAGCGGDDAPRDGGAGDAAADAGPVGAPAIPWLAAGVPPIAIAPCPAGWREVIEDGVTTCDPYPEGGAASCGPGEADFTGEPACRPIGDPCPVGDYATTLPTDGSVLYVNAAAAPGGDGTLATPYAGLSEVGWSSLASGTTVALAKGTYEGTLPLRPGVEVVGACVAETIVTGTTAPVSAVITATGSGAPGRVRNVTITDSPQMGVRADAGRAIDLAGVLVERALDVGIFASGAAAVITAQDVVVRDTQPEPGGVGGRGVDIEDGARFEGSRLVVTQNRDLGVFAIGAGAQLVLADAVVRDTREQENDGSYGVGIEVLEGAHLSASRLLVEHNRVSGMVGHGDGTELALEDAVVRDTQADARTGMQGRGINVEDGARFDASRLLIAASRNAGLIALGATVALTDAVVRDTASQIRDGEGGVGIYLDVGAGLQASRVLVLRSRGVGVFAGGESTAIVLDDVAVRDTHGEESDLIFGHGVLAQNGASITGERLSIDTARELGLGSLAGASVELTDVSIRQVERSECACDRQYGHGVVVVDASVRLERFALRDAATCGVFLATLTGAPDSLSLDLESGVVERAEIGACVQIDGYDLTRLMHDVAYRDNGTNLESTMLPVPMVAPSL